MKQWLVNLLIKNVLVKATISGLDKLFKKLGPDGGKTIASIVVAVLGIIAQTFPETTMYIGPVIEAAKPHAGEIVAGSLAYMVVGLAHKLVKFIQGKIEE